MPARPAPHPTPRPASMAAPASLGRRFRSPAIAVPSVLALAGLLAFGCASRDDGGGGSGPVVDAGPGGGGGAGGSGMIPTGGQGQGGQGQGGQGGQGQGGQGQGGSGPGCDDEAPPAACDGLSPRACSPRAGTNGATLIRGTVVSPDEVICDGEVLIDRASRKILCVGADCSGEPLAAAASRRVRGPGHAGHHRSARSHVATTRCRAGGTRARPSRPAASGAAPWATRCTTR
jgi:hypothetical protein